MRLQNWTRRACGFIHTIGRGPKLHPLQSWVWHLWLMRCRATELARCLWEKDKRPVESIETGALVFITLVYRLNSHLHSPSAKCPLDLLLLCPHLKQFIKNEWEESKTVRRWEGAVDRKKTNNCSMDTGKDCLTKLSKVMFKFIYLNKNLFWSILLWHTTAYLTVRHCSIIASILLCGFIIQNSTFYICIYFKWIHAVYWIKTKSVDLGRHTSLL